MKAYMVTFACEDNGVFFNHYAVFYAETISDLTEQIFEYQEEWEDTSNVIVISKDVKEINEKTCL